MSSGTGIHFISTITPGRIPTNFRDEYSYNNPKKTSKSALFFYKTLLKLSVLEIVCS
jgi:hypothetical protein